MNVARCIRTTGIARPRTCARLPTTAQVGLHHHNIDFQDPAKSVEARCFSLPLRAGVSQLTQADTSSIVPSVSLPVPGLEGHKWSNLWLRDNCQCHECVHPETRQRLLDTFSLPEDGKPSTIKPLDNGLEIEWAGDGHKSTYTYEWLKNHTSSSAAPTERPSIRNDLEYVESTSKSLPSVEYEEVMSSDEGIRRWTSNIYRFGFSFVKGSPATPEATERLLERLAFIRPTHYVGGFWDFTSDLSMKDTAYTSQHLNAHTDTTYFTDPAGLQLFHILSHTDGKGGETLLVDGFKAARTLLEEDPVAYQALSDIKISSHSSGNEDVCIQPATSFSVLNHMSDSSELYQIRWNNDDRAPGKGNSLETIHRWYQAAKKWNDILKRPDMEIWLKLEPGTPLIFDNWRILHGRSAFTGKRRMCGGYINHDDFISRYRLLNNGRDQVLAQI
ncbi:Trimethyllysine dioxygenase TmlH [Trichophyton interdigitale]|uniref:Trimethyllysine dioxygenase n=1 Tax=Trichophyton interdigitale TaxID=101480 RepID=A0A9P4YGR9_9EURO|nr:Trimethyllysine dioxygenase TmlH [Trichophyton interdigitale]KAF3894262.1 Trimethyllysine dioxygenase TmlH [Trichophyton interdigitale]KAG8208000.1 Trimethyllysine dioxygenase TmlH [Trichophyton interdigitale]